jgi:hypothetical protein
MATGTFTALPSSSSNTEMVSINSTTGVLSKQAIPTGLPPSGTASGDLSGTFPSPTVAKIQGKDISTTSPTNGQILQWDGVAWTPGAIPSGGSGGGGQIYFFNYQNTTGISPTTGLPTTPVPPSQLGITYNATSNSINSANLTQGVYTLVCGFVTIVGTPGVTTIPAGLWDFNIWASVIGSSGPVTQSQFQVRVYKYDSIGGTYTSLANSDNIFIYDPSVIEQYSGNVTMPQTTILSTDRIYIELWAQKNVNQSRQVSFHFDSAHPSHVHTTLPSVSGTGLVKVINGVYQTPASTLVNTDVDANAAIAVSKLAMATNKLLGRGTAGSGAVEEITLGTGLTLSGTTLNASAGGSRSVIGVSSGGTVSAGSTAGTDYVYLVSVAATIALPSPTGLSNSYTIKRTGAGLVTITTPSGTIDGSASPITINVQNVSITIVTDGTNWFII